MSETRLTENGAYMILFGNVYGRIRRETLELRPRDQVVGDWDVNRGVNDPVMGMFTADRTKLETRSI